MCMFCVIQKWSRRVATMLPWLVIPLIGLWAFSQLLPPPFRFEITSPRLACLFVLLVTLCWYEVLMPFLSAWRLRRNARLRERKRFEALELQKLKKTATRKCRNCLTPYRDQNPGGGKFMCSYCGHISKRPVLDLPVPPGMDGSNSGIIKDLFGKGGRILYGKCWPDNVSICSQDWMENGSWIVNGSIPVKSGYPLRKSDGFFSGSEPCLGEKSYSGSLFLACKLSTPCLASIRWLWRKVFWISSSKDDSSSDADHRGMSSKKGENSLGAESRGEKARRKAEEKRQARLEKELLEEEERKQREEVSRLVEERRRLRDEKMEAENRAKGTFSLRENSKKETGKRRQERRKEKDKGSSKSNSDVEELDKKVGKDFERKRDTERKSENDRRESLKTGLDTVESGMGSKSNRTNNYYSQGHVGARYFNRMRGTFLSSSKAFTSRGFFGKAAPTHAPASKEVKLGASSDYSFVSSDRRDVYTPDRLGKTFMNRDGKSDIRPVTSDTQLKTTSMSWQHLFTRSTTAPSSSHSNVISRPSAKSQLEMQNPEPPCSMSSPQLYDNPINLPLPFVLPSFSTTVCNNCSLPAACEMSRDLLPEEPELFEDPCYEPDPVSLLGPVSESLDNFQLDLGNIYRSDEPRKSHHSINVSSPIESPISRQKVSDEKQNKSIRSSNSPKATDMYTFPNTDVNGMSEQGSWHMWNFSPLGPDGLSLFGGPVSWIAPLEHSRLNNEQMIHYTPQKTMASLFTKDETHSPHKVLAGNAQTCTPFGSSIPSSNDREQPWLQNTYFPALSSGESHVPTSPTKEANMVYGSSCISASNHAYDSLSANSWSKNEWAVQGNGNPTVVKSPSVPVGGLLSPPDVHSLW